MQRIQEGTALSVVMLPTSQFEEITERLEKIECLLSNAEESKSEWIESSVARKMLGVSAVTWQSYRDKRVIPFSQFGRKIYVRRSDIDAFLMSNLVDREG